MESVCVCVHVNASLCGHEPRLSSLALMSVSCPPLSPSVNIITHSYQCGGTIYRKQILSIFPNNL